MSKIELTESMQEVVDWLNALPRAHAVEIKVERYGTGTVRTEIKGGIARLNECVRCPTCGHPEWIEWTSASFLWQNGRFHKGLVHTSRHGRRERRSIDAVKKLTMHMHTSEESRLQKLLARYRKVVDANLFTEDAADELRDVL